MSDTTIHPADYLSLTAQIVSAHVSHNSVEHGELPALIGEVHKKLLHIAEPSAVIQKGTEPAVPIKKSVFPDYIICLDDGKKMKMLKRHLAGLGMTPAQYRAKWGLPSDYPMVAPNYAEQRSELAREIGLGHKRADRG